MFEDIKKILAEQLRIDSDTITPDSKIMDDLGADSLDILQLLMTLEEDYGIVIPDEELASFEKVSDITAYMEKNKK